MRERARNPHEIAADFVSRHHADTTWRQRIPGGTMRPPCEFSRDALAAGLAVELEHTTDPAIALEIAMDHLDEDPKYYAKAVHNPRRKRNPAPVSRQAQISRRVRGV
jgi:hypothetical protein